MALEQLAIRPTRRRLSTTDPHAASRSRSAPRLERQPHRARDPRTRTTARARPIVVLGREPRPRHLCERPARWPVAAIAARPGPRGWRRRGSSGCTRGANVGHRPASFTAPPLHVDERELVVDAETWVAGRGPHEATARKPPRPSGLPRKYGPPLGRWAQAPAADHVVLEARAQARGSRLSTSSRKGLEARPFALPVRPLPGLLMTAPFGSKNASLPIGGRSRTRAFDLAERESCRHPS